MASVRKCKGTKTSLTIGKKSAKYRKLSESINLKQSLSSQQEAIPSELPHIDTFPTSPTAESHQRLSNEIHHVAIVMHVEKGIQSDNIHINIVEKQHALTQATVTHVDKETFTDQMKKHNACTQYYSTNFNGEQGQAGEALLRHLLCDNAWYKFAQLLSDNDQTHKFVQLITALGNQKMKFTNMSWKSALDMGSLYMCSTTSNMVYDREWLEFCQVLYHMFSGGVMNTLRGRAHFSHIASERSKKGLFKPIEGEFNFPVPSVLTLKKLDIGYPLEIPVGFIEHSLNLAEEASKRGEEFILSFDGKLISLGCKSQDVGDCNMWGKEGPPNIRRALKILDHTIDVASQIDNASESHSLDQQAEYLQNLLFTSTMRIKRLRQHINGIFYLRKKLIANNGDSEELKYKYRCRMSTLNHNTAECNSVVRCLLEINIQLTKLLSTIQRNSDVHVNLDLRHIELSEQSNCFMLLPPDIAKYAVDLENDDNSHYVKQGSEKWFQMRKLSRVTGSTLRASIGLDTLAKQKEHYYVHITGRIPPPPTPQLQKLFDHGKKNEVNGVGTIVGTLLPAFLPECYAFSK